MPLESDKPVVHLHVHTSHSMLDGMAEISEAAEKAANDDQPALGITDHGTLSGLPVHYTACRKEGIKPILGCELYMAAESVEERPSQRRKKRAPKVDPKSTEKPAGHNHDGHNHDDCKAPSTEIPTDGAVSDALKGMDGDTGGATETGVKAFYHLLVVAQNMEGYRNLVQLSSRSYREGFYRKPRVDWDMLAEHNEGLIATTGCLGSVVQQALLAGDTDLAAKRASRLKDIFGDRLYVEMQDHGIPEQHSVNPQLVDLARKLDIPLLATNDLHYLEKDDAHAHGAMLAEQTGSKITDENRFRFHGEEHYLKTSAEMRRAFDHDGQTPDWAKEAYDNTLLVAERVDNYDLPFDQGYHVPNFPKTPEGQDDKDYLRKLVIEGCEARYGNQFTDEIRERAEFELTVIEQMGFSSYFLIVWDICAFADRNGIARGPGRGSAGGSLVSYSLNITKIDPIKHGLMFERFLNPSRVSMPDIDLDFSQRRRSEMIEYTRTLYGADRVAQIATFGYLRAKASIDAAARVLDIPDYVRTAKRIKALIPPAVAGKSATLEACLNLEAAQKEGPRGQEFYDQAGGLRNLANEDAVVRTVTDLAQSLEGVIKSSGIHPAAVLISDAPVTDYIPIMEKKKNELGMDITQYDMNWVESLGLLKMDYLGLKNLDVIEIACQHIARLHGVTIDPDEIPLDDQPTLQLLAKGETIGIFQLESSGMRELLTLAGVTKFEDIPAVSALYRPGPMSAGAHYQWAERKAGREEARPLSPALARLDYTLGETQGLVVYQEQIMALARDLAGYDLAEADNLRKAAGKKIDSLMEKHKEKFLAGCIENDVPAAEAQSIWEMIQPFADYGFPKAHAYEYGVISWQVAYLKANFPTEYMAAMLQIFGSNPDKQAVLLGEARRMGIKLLPPDVNRSEGIMVPVKPSAEMPMGGIMYGLSDVKGVGDAKASAIIGERERNGPFKNPFDFALRLRGRTNAGVNANLAKVGALADLEVPERTRSDGTIVPARELTRKAMADSVKGIAKEVGSARTRAIAARRRELAKLAQTESEKAHAKKADIDLSDEEVSNSFYDKQAKLWEKIDAGEESKIAPLDFGADEFPDEAILELEMSLLGQFFTLHPMDLYASAERSWEASYSGLTRSPESVTDGDWVRIVGYVANINKLEVKRGKNAGRQMGKIALETREGHSFEVMLGADTWANYSDELTECGVIAIEGKAEVQVGTYDLDESDVENLDSGATESKEVTIWTKKIQFAEPDASLPVSERAETIDRSQALDGLPKKIVLLQVGEELALRKRDGKNEDQVVSTSDLAATLDRLAMLGSTFTFVRYRDDVLICGDDIAKIVSKLGL